MTGPKIPYHEPPAWLMQILKWFCAAQFMEEIEGDLNEMFQEEVERYGLSKARRRFFLAALKYIQPYFFNRNHISFHPLYHPDMLTHFLKIAFRHLLNHKTYTFINVFGFSVGITTFLLIGLYIEDELSYDQFLDPADQIYRITSNIEIQGNLYEESKSAFPLAEALVKDFPEIETTLRIYRRYNFPMIEFGEKKFSEENVLFCDSNFFNVFPFEWIQGNPTKALSNINSIVITEGMAQKYFGTENPIGKVLQFDHQHRLEVSGVIENVPHNTHLQFDFVVPLALQLGIWQAETGLEGRENKWIWTGTWTYFKRSPNASIDGIKSKLPAFINQYYPQHIKEGVELPLQPIKSIHLHSHLGEEIKPNNYAVFIKIFLAVALLTLIIAAINFVNLAIAQSVSRAKEVGVRKALGASRPQVLVQMLGESFLISLISIIITINLASVLLPSFNKLTDKEILQHMIFRPEIIGALFVLAILMTIIAGLYPAYVASRFNTINILKGFTALGQKKNSLRKAMVVFQFVASVTLMVSIGVIQSQFQFINQKELGFDKENVLIVKARENVNKKFEVFKQNLTENNPNILSVAGASNVPGQGMWVFRFIPEDGSREEPLMLPLAFVDYDFIPTMGINLVKGRNFSQSNAADKDQAFIINQKAAELMGWQEDPLGKQLELFAPGTTEIYKTGKVIGLIEDYHFESLHSSVRPLIMTYDDYHNFYMVRVTGDYEKAVSHLATVWNSISPDWPLEYYYLDKELAMLYSNEKRLQATLGYFTILAILIAAIGLFGLGAYTTMLRVKELGIRKVLGAKMTDILSLIYKDFIQLALIANLIAWPIAYLFMKNWLEQFAYQTSISWLIFALVGLVSILIAVLATSFHAIKAARINPIESIKFE